MSYIMLKNFVCILSCILYGVFSLTEQYFLTRLMNRREVSVQKLPFTRISEDDGHLLAEDEIERVQQYSWRATLIPWSKAVKAVLLPFFLTRLLFLILTYLEILFIVPTASTNTIPLRTLLHNWDHWDANEFVLVATQGYNDVVKAAFFPLYPLLEAGGSLLLHVPAYISGLIISNLAFLGVLIVMYRLVESEFDAATAQRSIFYLSIFPTAFFFFAGYNESLFLLFVLLFFYALRRGSWWLAGLFGAIAMLTRSAALILPLIFCFEFIRQVLPKARQAWHDGRLRQIVKLCAGLPAVLLPFIALGMFAFYLKLRLGDPLAFSHAQASWGRKLEPPWVGIAILLRNIHYTSPGTFFTVHDLIDLTAFLLFVGLTILSFVGPERISRDQWSLPIYSACMLLFFTLFPVTFGDSLVSMERFVLELFPAFILLARFGRREWFHQSYPVLALPLLGFFTLQFLSNYWIV
jgi:hypothetical protein